MITITCPECGSRDVVVQRITEDECGYDVPHCVCRMCGHTWEEEDW